MLAIIGYLVTGLPNDSVVPVAPVFRILLDVGTAINAINRHASKPKDEQNTTEQADVSVYIKERHIDKAIEDEGAELAARIRAKL